jgi:acetyltransferase-like isoleucine patch superfamily enzyme
MTTAESPFTIHRDVQLFDPVVLEPPFRIYPQVIVDTVAGGAFSYLSPQSRLRLVNLGRYCSIGDRVTVLSNHPTDRLSTSAALYDSIFAAPFDRTAGVAFDRFQMTSIGNDVWIGAGAQIKSGVTIGDGAIIGAGAVVVKDVAAFTVVGGVPARKIRDRFDEAMRDRIQRLQWWRYDIMRLNLRHDDINATLDGLEAAIASGAAAPYRPAWVQILIENDKIIGRPYKR